LRRKSTHVFLCLAAALTLLTACSTDELTTDGSNTTQKSPFTVGDFPTYSTDATTRTIGTADAGKTAWAAGDVILVKAEQYSGYDANNKEVSGTVSKTTLYKMTCTAAASAGTAATWSAQQWDATNSTWTTPTGLTAGSYEEGLKITAYYAPNYEWNTTSNELALSSGKTAGTSEMLSVVQQMQFVKLSNAASIDIDFSKATRDYSRLRIAAVPNATIAFTCTGFTPVGASAALGNTAVSLTTDAKGNAYMYGSWTASTMAASITVDGTSYSLASKSVTTVPVANTSYALNAIPTTYNKVGAGTSASPYRIYNATQLQDINNGTISHLGTGPTDDYIVICNGAYFSMENDVICSTSSTFTPIGYDNGMFAGTFEGNGHTISNLTLGVNSTKESGLFGVIYNSTIQNLVLSNPTGTPNTQYVGALAGYAQYSKILNCGVTVTDNNTYSITNSSTNDPTYVGGLVGYTYQAYIVACYANIPVSTIGTSTDGNDQAGYKTGGLVGLVGEGSFVYASYATGNVTAQDNNDIGGLIGYLNSGTVSGCYASGAFSASSSTYVGGLVGQNPYEGTISYCATTSTTGTAAKGGTNGTDYTGIGANSATVTGCYGNISSYADIYNYITPAAAETAWESARTNLPDSYAGKTKTLDELWQKDVSSSLKLYWEK
jgi:hypothetical protein